MIFDGQSEGANNQSSSKRVSASFNSVANDMEAKGTALMSVNVEVFRIPLCQITKHFTRHLFNPSIQICFVEVHWFRTG